MSKSKRRFPSQNPFVEDLLPGEHILWMDQPDAWRIFQWYNLFMIPFGLFWCAITFSMFGSILLRGQWWTLLIPHVWVGPYLLFGRFLYQIWRK